MQLVLSNNRIIAHGENFLSMGGVVINTVTGAKYENATIAECNGCPSDIDKVGYEYHAGVSVPCAPFGVGNNNGFFMEVCESCATPRSSGIPIKGGIKKENIFTDDFYCLLWENASPTSQFAAQTITLAEYDWDFLICEASKGYTIFSANCDLNNSVGDGSSKVVIYTRPVTVNSKTSIKFGAGRYYAINSSGGVTVNDGPAIQIPLKIYGVKL